MWLYVAVQSESNVSVCVQADRILALPAVRAKAKQLGIELPQPTAVSKVAECPLEQLAFGNRAPRYSSGKPYALLRLILSMCL